MREAALSVSLFFDGNMYVQHKLNTKLPLNPKQKDHLQYP